MPWVIDTCVIIDILDDDPEYGVASAKLLRDKLRDGLLLCPVTYVELAPAFDGSAALQDTFLAGLGTDWRQPWAWQDTKAAHTAWNRHVAGRRARSMPPG